MEDIPLETALRKATKQAQKLPNSVHEARRKVFMDAWFKCEGNTNATARYLNIHRVQVWRYRREFGLL